MPVRIRLSRFGRKHAPEYKIVVANGNTGRDKKPIEVIGYYNPVPIFDGQVKYKDVKLDFARAKYWIGVGAQPTETVSKLLAKLELIPHKPSIFKDPTLSGCPKE